jgi:hypothetical protein
MNLFIYTGAPDLSNCAATTLADCNALIAALANPTTMANANTLARINSSFPQLVLGDNEPLVVKFLSAASTYETWSGDASYTLSASLGLPMHDGSEFYAQAGTFSTVTNGWSGRMALSTQELVDFVQQAIGASVVNPRFPFQAGSYNTGGQLTLQITVTDSSGNRETYSIPTVRIVGRVDATGVSAPSPAASYLTAAEIAALYSPRLPSGNAQANSSGNSTVEPASNANRHIEIVSFSGSGSTTRVVILSTTGRQAWDTITLRGNLPATAAITVEVRNASAAGTLLTSITSDGSGDDFAAEFVFDGSAFIAVRTQYPA